MRQRPNALHRLRILCITALALLPAVAAQAADWRYREPAGEAPAQLLGFVTASDGSIWSWDQYGVRRSDSSGTRIVHRSAAQFGMAARALADGSVLLVSSTRRTQDSIGGTADQCTILHAGATARPPRLFTREDCQAIVLNADGGAWVRSASTLYLLGRDGTERRRLQFGAQETVLEIVGHADGGVLVRSRGGSGAASRVSYLAADGSLRWERMQADALGIAAVADGGAYVAAKSATGLAVTRVDAAGSTLWTRDSLPRDEFMLQLATAADGSLYVVNGRSYFNAFKPTGLQRIGADGSSAWNQPFCVQGQSLAYDTLTLDSDGNSAVVCNDDQGSMVLLRRGADGGTLARVTLPFAHKRQLSALPGGGLRALGLTQDSAPARLVDIGQDQRIQPTAADAASDAAVQALYAGVVDGDGSSYLLTAQKLSKVSADGRLLWRTDSPNFVLNSGSVSVAGGQVCAKLFNSVAPGNGNSHRYTLRCFDSATGSPLWRDDTAPSSGGGVNAAIAALADGNSLALSVSPGSYTLDLRDRNGTRLRRVEGTGRFEQAHFDRSGRAYLVVDNTLRHYGADGNLRYRSGGLPASPSVISSDEDGSVYLYGRESGQQGRLWSIDSGGTTRWQTSVPALIDKGRLLVRSNAVYLLQWGRLSRYAAATGQLQWQRDSAVPGYGLVDPRANFALDASGSVLVQVYSQDDRLRFERIDAANGNLLGEHYAACGFLCNQVAALGLDADGSARVLLTSSDGEGQTAAALALPGVAGDAARIAVGQPGIGGAWGSLYANGEGVALEWLPDSRTLFGAWFTYRSEGGNDPAGLRWYTLQANGVSTDARETSLAILATENGQFAAGPPVAPRQVGTAVLDFTDCNNSTLRYRFDAGVNDGRSGTITLARLSPATQPCRLADGSSQPGAGARPPSKGFDARLSGNWFDPATGGQGLQFTVQPGGVFFAPWFTFDTADAGNDPARQHWFTLQGDLSTAANGRVELLLVQTLGGAFDRVPTYNANAVGTATLRILDCARAELDYRFDDDFVAGPFRARNGSLRLQRAGGCAP